MTVTAKTVSDPLGNGLIFVSDDLDPNTVVATATATNAPANFTTYSWAWTYGPAVYSSIDLWDLEGVIKDTTVLPTISALTSTAYTSNAHLTHAFPWVGFYWLIAIATVTYYDSNGNIIASASNANQSGGDELT